MKLFSMAIAGAALLGSLAIGSVTASAQGVGIGVGPGGVYVGSNDGYRGRGDGYRRDRGYRSRAYYGNRRDRDVVVVKKRVRPDGTVVIRRDRY